MAKLSYYQEVVKNSKKQIIVIECDYDPADESVNDIEVHLFDDGKYIGEFSLLLDKADGDPLSAMIDAVNWRELYRDHDENKLRVA